MEEINNENKNNILWNIHNQDIEIMISILPWILVIILSLISTCSIIVIYKIKKD